MPTPLDRALSVAAPIALAVLAAVIVRKGGVTAFSGTNPPPKPPNP